MKQHLLKENAINDERQSLRDRGLPGNLQQQAAISATDRAILCIAGPGSGKTFTITQRIRYLILEKHIDPYHILVITFSKASAIEMQKRFLALMNGEYYPVRFGTFHAIFFQILSRYEAYNTNDILTNSQKKKYLKTTLLQMNYQGKLDIDSMENILSHISYFKNHNNTALFGQIEKDIPQFGEIYQKYEKLIRQEHKLDFDDMMLLCHELLQKRPDILNEFRRDIEHLLIDEYQDINPVQYELVKKLTEPDGHLFAVGDDDQSIYGFRGCEPGIMLDFKRQFPQGEIITFPINYRCSAPIVDAANHVITRNTKRFEKKMNAVGHEKNCNEKNVEQNVEPVHLNVFENKEAEYEYLIFQLKNMSREKLNNCACLFRTNMDASYLAELLLREKIPYQMKEKPYNPYEHFISKDFLHYLHLKEGDIQMEEFVPVMNRPVRYISRDAIDTLSMANFDALKKFYREKEYMLHNIERLEYDLKRMKSMDVFAAINYVRKGIGYDDFLCKYAASQNVSLEDYLKMADEIQRRFGMFSSLEQLENHIDSYREMSNTSHADNKKSGINIMTYHASKGLEFDTVFLPDCNEGVIPYRKSTTPEQIEEERRLFYVAMTRAKESLHILYLDGEKGNRHLVSRFVKDAKGGGRK